MPNSTELATPTQTDLLKRFRKDLPFYSSSCLKIRTKQAEIRYLELNEAQTLVHEKISRQRQDAKRVRAIVLKARQEGVSTYTAARFFRRTHLWSGTQAMVVADSLERAGVLYDIYARFYEHLPPEITPVKRAGIRRRSLGFQHDSEIAIRPASDTEAGRAMTIHMLHASELAFWGTVNVSAYETWVSLLQAVPHTNSEVIVESTAKGAGGFFHEMWEQAEDGETGWLPIFLPWWIHGEYASPVTAETVQLILDTQDDFEHQALTEGFPFEGGIHQLTMDQLAWRREIISERFGGDFERLGRDATRMFQQEYPATAEEAFLVSGSCFFDEDVLRKMTRTAGEPDKRGILQDDAGTFRFAPSDRGSIKIYQMPREGHHYVIGADTAEGKLVSTRAVSDTATAERGGRDFSSAVVWDVHENKAVAECHGRLAPEVFTDQLRMLGHFYACGGPSEGTARQVALIGVERSHSSGQTVLRLLHEFYKYPRLYWKREFNKRTRQMTRMLGWVTDNTTRMPMLDELAMLVRREQVDIPSKDIVREMVTFVVWEDGKPQAEEGTHDDRVIALGIAVQMAREHRHASAEFVPTFEVRDTQTGL